MRKTFLLKYLLLICLLNNGFSQANFVPRQLITLPGVNTNFEIGAGYIFDESPVFLCWENHNDTSGFNIYRMDISPYSGSPQIIASSNDSLLNPEVNYLGDVVWQEKQNGNWVLKYFSEANGNTVTLTDHTQNSTQPTLSNSNLVFVQDDQLIYLNLYNQETVLIDSGVINHPDLNPEAYSSYWNVTYEKQHQDTTSIFIASKRTGELECDIRRYTSNQINKYPQFGSSGGVVYQTLEDNVWNAVIEDFAHAHIPNAQKPVLLSFPIPVNRVIDGWMVFYECDSVIGNSEIYAYSLLENIPSFNISNLQGNDFNPRTTILSMDTIAVFWEHEGENGREIWWAKDSFHMPEGSIGNDITVPAAFGINSAFPNPFNGMIQFDYSIKAKTNMTITIYNLNGKLVTQTIIKRNFGEYTYSWNGTNSEGIGSDSGVYIVRFSDSDNSLSRKIVLLK